MDDVSKTKEELILELQELRRQLAKTQGNGDKTDGSLKEGATEGQKLVELPKENSEGFKTANGSGLNLMECSDASIKILLIEDNPGDARLVREMITDAGAHTSIKWVQNLSEGLEYLQKDGIDLVLLDLRLPDSNGLETFSTAYSAAPEMPFVLLTGLDDETVALAAVQKGAQDYLIKGKTDANRLFQAIRYASGRKKVQETLRRSRDELERRVEERTEELLVAKQHLEEEVAHRRETEAKLQRLLAEIQNYSEELQIANEDLINQTEELQVKNKTLNAQSDELEDLNKELQAGRNLQRAVLEQMPAGVIIAEAPSGRIILTNCRAEAILGQLSGFSTAKEKFGQIQLFYPDSRPCPADSRPLIRALTLGETVADEEYLLQKDAGDHLEIINLSISASPVRDQHGSIIAAAATYTDITSRKEAQSALQQSEERYRNLVELSPDAIVVHVRGKIEFVNEAAIRLFGATNSQDLLDQPILDRIHPEFRDSILNRIITVRSGGTVSPMEEKILRLNGEAVEVESVGSAVVYQGRHAVHVIFRDITQRNRARKALSKAKAKLQALIEASPLAIVHLDRQGIIEDLNPAAERIFGWREAELLGRPLPIALEKKQWKSWEIIQGVLRGEPLTGLEVRARRKDSAWIDVSLSLAPMYDGNGAVTGIVGLAEDISARKQAEAALAKSRAEFEAIFNSISDAIIFADQERRIILANPAVKKLFGYEPKELIGQNTEKLYINRAEYEKAEERYYSLRERSEPDLFEISYRRKNGTIFSAESLASPVKDAQGNILGGVGIHRDITARKIADAALKESHRQVMMLADYLENSSQPFAVGFFNGHIGMYNEAFCQLVGYEKGEFSGLNWIKDLTPPEWRELEAAKLEELQCTGKPARYEKEYVRKNGTRVPVELFVQLRRDDKGQPLLYYAFVTDITARQEAAAALAESEARFRSVFEGAPIGIAIVDFEEQILRINPALQELLGYDRFELEGKNVADITYPDDIQKDFNKFKTIVDGEANRYTIEKRFVCKDGRIVWGHMAVSLIRDSAGLPKFAVGMVEDVTARKKAEASLEQERQRLFDLLNALPAFVSLHAEDYTLRFANRRFLETFGETEGRFCYEMLYGSHGPCEGCPLPTIIDNQTMYEGERTSDDGRTLQIYKYPFRDTDGSPCVLSLALDITDRKQAETALKESEERFRQLAENIDDAIVLISGDLQKIYYVSPAYERIWGRSCASLYEDPRSWQKNVAPEDQEGVKFGLRKITAGDFSEKEFPHFRICRPDGDMRWIAMRLFPIKDESGENYRIVGIATDITERKEVETVLRWREEHLRQTAKMEAVGRLAGGVAHDFNNLLTVISGYGELLLADLENPEQGRQQVQAILKATDQATVVTRQLLAFSRKQVLQPQIIDLNELIIGMVEMLSRLVDKNIKISTKLDPESGAVKADPSHMEQVIMNLAINALDAMPQEGSLTIETANVKVDHNDGQGYPEIPRGVYVVVTVQDTGIGMKQEVLSHIFEPFFTTKERGKGTGLGLSMAYGIIKQSGGHIRVESSPGKGSTFKIYLPRLTAPRKLALSAAPTQASAIGTGTILLVEDEEGVRYVVNRMLRQRGFEVLTAHDAYEALKMGQEHLDPIHLLLTDVAMPGMGGRELSERLCATHPEMKVLFMSGHAEDGMVRRGVRDSVINFLQKPFSADQLLSKVGELLADLKP